MTKEDVVNRMAVERRVEEMIARIVPKRGPEMDDLAQIIYLALLEAPEDVIVSAEQEGWLNFRIVRMIRNQYFRKSSTYKNLFDRYTKRATDLGDIIAGDEGER